MTTQTIEPRMELEQNLHMYRQMAKIRAFEEQVNELYKSAKMPGLAHLYVGEEAVAVGVCEALRRDDFITSTHRGHGHCLAKGASVNRMFAELLGKEPGYCRGKGGSMHIADPETGNLGANAIVGGSAGIATGAALSAKMRGSQQVAVCFFGDGALGQGLLYESMNMASLWKLPVVYVCENNLYGEYTPCGETIAGDILARPKALGVHAESVDGQDVQAVNATMRRLVERARRGEGPAFLECKTYRYYGHHVGDVNREYRTRDEEREWMSKHDPLQTLSARLEKQGLADASVFERIQTDVKAEIDNGGIVDPHLTIDNTATAVTDQADPTAIGSASVQVEQKPHLTLTKTASIPDGDGDGKIDSPADDITYTFAIVNDGNMTLHNVQLVDSLLGSLTTHTETGGTGTNGDGILDVGETWTYTADYLIQDADVTNGGVSNDATATTLAPQAQQQTATAHLDLLFV